MLHLDAAAIQLSEIEVFRGESTETAMTPRRIALATVLHPAGRTTCRERVLY